MRRKFNNKVVRKNMKKKYYMLKEMFLKRDEWEKTPKKIIIRSTEMEYIQKKICISSCDNDDKEKLVVEYWEKCWIFKALIRVGVWDGESFQMLEKLCY